MPRAGDTVGAPAVSGGTGSGPAGSSLRRLRPGRPASVRLPHAGGWPGCFRPWSPLLPPYAEQLAAHCPGRESRGGEPCATRADELVDAVVEALEQLRDPPLVLFGHGMGASVAHEVALRLHETGAPPAHPVVPERQSPTLRHVTSLHLADDETFLAHIRPSRRHPGRGARRRRPEGPRGRPAAQRLPGQRAVRADLDGRPSKRPSR
ncbi:thioesterase II family protein [Streptomyces thermolilacinus]|nr:thioesterase domain-containing protein [Streptomyces thermolilacinus]